MFSKLCTVLLMAVLAFHTPVHADQKPNDKEALAGLKTAKVIFDVRVPDMEKLVFNLELINETYEGLRAEGVKPIMVVSFRGPDVNLLTSSAISKEALEAVRVLKKKNIRVEVCSVATRVFKVDNAAIISEVKVVGNVFNSYIGYQNKGYALIAIN